MLPSFRLVIRLFRGIAESRLSGTGSRRGITESRLSATGSRQGIATSRLSETDSGQGMVKSRSRARSGRRRISETREQQRPCPWLLRPFILPARDVHSPTTAVHSGIIFRCEDLIFTLFGLGLFTRKRRKGKWVILFQQQTQISTRG